MSAIIRVIKFSEITTVRVGGEIHELIVCSDEKALVSAINMCKKNRKKYQIVAGGSNILPPDFCGDMTVIWLQPSNTSPNGTEQTFVWAGETLDLITKQYNLAALSGIPGSIGGAVVQNAGAYGAQISDFVESVKILQIRTGEISTFTASECYFAYRNSRFKGNQDEIVLSIKLKRADSMQLLRYQQLQDVFAPSSTELIHVDDIRREVLKLRATKGMLAYGFVTGDVKIDSSNIGSADIDRQSVGSFFMNPVISHQSFLRLKDVVSLLGLDVENIPHWTENEYIKVSAALLIEQAGFTRGFQMSGHRCARLSSKHTLALINSCSALDLENFTPSMELRLLASHIQESVFQKFDIQLNIEPIIL